MKQNHPHETAAADLTAWLQQFDFGAVLAKMADLCHSAAVIIVDRQQKVRLWSLGAEKITGLSRTDVLGQPVIKECSINDQQPLALETIKLTRADGSVIELDRYYKHMINNEKVFSGTMLVLLPVAEAATLNRLPDIASSEKHTNFHGILSRSPTMRSVFQVIQNAARTEATVLVRGESGSGKELVAQAIHDLSSRSKAPFLAINCAALSASLLESELFGHVRGAFTGAIKDHSGLFQRAHGGTLFLDEVAELPLELQAKLLRVLQERSYIPVGGTNTIDVDVRIVAATHRSLREEVKAQRFREDLMYRLRVVPIYIPPLRERREDISLLLWHFIKQNNANGFRQIVRIDPQAMQILLDYPWPGNVRELQNVVEYSFAVGRGTVLRVAELPPEFREPLLSPKTLQIEQPKSAEHEKDAIRQALQQSNGKITAAARMLGMSRATFWRKRKQFGI